MRSLGALALALHPRAEVLPVAGRPVPQGGCPFFLRVFGQWLESLHSSLTCWLTVRYMS